MHSFTIPGWEVLHTNELIAFKAPSQAPFINFLYGSVTLANFESAKKFYSSKPFQWLINKETDGNQLIHWGLKGPDIETEMSIVLAEYLPKQIPSHIEMRAATSDYDYKKWLAVAAEWLEMNISAVDEFFTPWIRISGSIPYLALINGEPAATSLIYCGSNDAAVYCLGTRPAFRRMGLGSAVTHACLQHAKNQNLERVVLYSSAFGKPLYEKIGFKTDQKLFGYSWTQ